MSKYFKPTELDCPCCGVAKMDPAFMAKLDALRAAYGRPINLTSAYRCAKNNKAVGGAKGSMHLKGRAVDIAMADTEARERFIALAKQYGFNGIGRGHTFVHIDDRETPASWEY